MGSCPRLHFPNGWEGKCSTSFAMRMSSTSTWRRRTRIARRSTGRATTVSIARKGRRWTTTTTTTTTTTMKRSERRFEGAPRDGGDTRPSRPSCGPLPHRTRRRARRRISTERWGSCPRTYCCCSDRRTRGALPPWRSECTPPWPIVVAGSTVTVTVAVTVMAVAIPRRRGTFRWRMRDTVRITRRPRPWRACCCRGSGLRGGARRLWCPPREVE
mmetsp:Transcript_3904/g.6119  ORF Transcript_3904/g.6119 Transcript_3904/m.6119 type:complete len:215 (+) Transcript_3904:307-951(+)